MALQATGPIKYSEIQAEFGSPAANTTTTSYTVPWVKWTPQTAWVKSSLGGGNASTPNWSQFMVDYAVYPSNTLPLIGTHTAIWRIGGGSMSFSGLPADTYTLECQSDNNSTFTWDDTYLGALPAGGADDASSFFTITNTQVTEHYLTVSVTNVDNGGGWSTNPAGVAWQLKNSSGTVIRSSTDSFNYDHASTGWGTFLNTYAVYPSTTSGLTDTWHETTYLFSTNSSSTYDFEAVADNQFEIYLYDIATDIETLWMNSTGNESCNIGSCNSITGAALDTNTTYRLRVRVYNGSQTPNIYGTNSWFNPGGVGFTIKDSSGTIIKSSNDTGFQGSIVTLSGSVKFGNYRMDNASEFGGMIVPLDTDCGPNSNLDIPTGTNPISFSNFYNARLNIGVDYYTADENRPDDAVTRFGDTSKRKVVGGFIGVPAGNDTSSSKVAIIVNKTISGKSAGVEDSTVNECSLRTGLGWDTGTKIAIQVGSSGRIYGAGGDGGGGGNVADTVNSSKGPNGLEFDLNGGDGENGTSALGIEWDNAVVKVRSGGRIVSGFGGGGGGGASHEDSIGERSSAGGGGGGGAGSPAGVGGIGGEAITISSAEDGVDGSAGSVPNGGEQSGAGGLGGGCTGQTPPFGPGGECESQGGAGGRGRDEETTGTGFDNDGTGQISLGRRYNNNDPNDPNGNYTGGNGGAKGTDGAAIRRTSGYTVTITNDGTIAGETIATGVS